MERSAGTVCAIKALGYPDGSCLARCECDELPCPLLTWLTAELDDVCPELQDSLRTGDILLVGELRSFLSNMMSPLTDLTSEVLVPSILNKVAEFLVSELQAARIIEYKESHSEETTAEDEPEKKQRVEDELFEKYDEKEEKKAEIEAEWMLLLHSLDMDASSQLPHVLNEVERRLALLPCGDMMNPLLNTSLSTEQWIQLKRISQILSDDYQCRQQMMIKRFQVTLQSFSWGEKQKRSEALTSVPLLSSLAGSSQVSLSVLLAAREDKSLIQPIKAGITTPIYKTLMGSVPDRGGRPGEIEPPMPSWGDRKAKPNRSGGGRHQHSKFSKKKGKKER
ncbi:protein FAM98B isoform X2 [Antennarius striatus]|uniref:protein FAM98B isoform X2 n=1 Tax=Antennarius striatus TaxID=241820 RepID=UPI0035B4F5C0